MATLLNQSEQIGVLFEVISVRDDWVFSHIAFQHYVAKENDFASWVEGYLEIYETDFKCLARDMATFAEERRTEHEFRFEPEVEPSFELRFQARSSARRQEVLASVALDVKRILDLTIPTAYRDNRISLQVLTDWDRIRRFAEQFSQGAAKLWVTR
jgi:hypothetical protein